MILFTRNHCSACRSVKQLLAASDREWREVNIEDEPEMAMELVNAGIRTVPVLEDIETGERFVGAAAIQQYL